MKRKAPVPDPPEPKQKPKKKQTRKVKNPTERLFLFKGDPEKISPYAYQRYRAADPNTPRSQRRKVHHKLTQPRLNENSGGRAGAISKFTSARVTGILRELRKGTPIHIASNLHGVSDAAVASWRKKGKGLEDITQDETHPHHVKYKDLTKIEKAYIQFYQDFNKARAEGERGMVDVVRASAYGGDDVWEIREIVRRVYNEKLEKYENVVVERVKTRRTRASQWQAAAWYLERIHPQTYSKKVELVDEAGKENQAREFRQLLSQLKDSFMPGDVQ